MRRTLLASGRKRRLLLTAALIALSAAPAAAQADPSHFDIPAQSLGSALNAFSAQSGYRLLYPNSPALRRTSRPISGASSSDKVLQSLLKGSGLRVISKKNNVITLGQLQTAVAPPPPPAARPERPPVIRAAAFQDVPAAEAPAASAEIPEAMTDIVVTATRREERLQDVPVAVTALTAAMLDERQILDVDDLQRAAPNLSIAPFGDRTTLLVALRGQVATDNISSVDPAVGIYLDGVYIARSTGGNLSLIDMERVEVLRGPQGTLFGRNTIGGAISLSTKKPTSRLEGWISGSYGNYDLWSLTGVVNVPITDGVAVRLVGQHSERDGFAKSTITGSELNAENLDYVRGSLSIDLGPDWNLLVGGDYTSFRNDGQWITLLKTLPLADQVAAVASGGTQTASQYIDVFSKHIPNTMGGPFISRNWGFSGTLSGSLGPVNVKSITSYRKMHRFLNDFDQDGTPFELLQLDNTIDQHQFSQELQLYGKAVDDRLDWIVGAYYFDEKAHDYVPQHFIFPVNPNYPITEGRVRNKSASLYGQLDFDITRQLSLVAGVRYTQDTRQIRLFNRTAGATPEAVIRCNTAGGVLPTCEVAPPKRKFSYWPFTIGLNYEPSENVLLYGKLSRGFRSGGFNLRANAALALQPFGPERLDSYEIGAKLDLLRMFRFNVALFQSRFSNIQFSTIQDAGGGVNTVVIANAGKARVNGVEIEASAYVRHFRLGATLGYTDAKYTKLIPNVTGVNLDSRFPFTPKWNYSLDATYSIPTSIGEVELHADWSWRSRIAYQLVPPANPANLGPSYGLLNGQVTLKSDHGWQVSAWGRNLADKKYINRVTDLTAAGFFNAYPGDPRTYGLTAKYTF